MSGLHMKVVYGRTRVGGSEDVAVTTHDFYKMNADASGGEVTTIAGHWDTFWGAIKQHFPPSVKLQELRFYNGYDGDGTPGEVDYVFSRNAPGTSSNVVMIPPQCAVSVTERTPYRRHWGRFYLPSFSVSALDTDGSMYPTGVNAVANAAEIFYEAIDAMTDMEPIVWGHTGVVLNSILGATSNLQIAHPWQVTEVQVDEIVDVIRRRRWETVTNRQRRVLAEA